MKQQNKRTCFSAIVQFRNYFLNSQEYKKLKKRSWAREPEIVGGLVSTITMAIVVVFMIIAEFCGSGTMSHPALVLIKSYIAFNIVLIIVVSIFGNGDIFSRNDLADYERLGKEIDRLIYDIVTRCQDKTSLKYRYSMDELDNDIKSIASVLNGMSRNFRSILSIGYQFREFAESMREFDDPERTDITPIRNLIETFDSFELPDFDQIYEFVKAIVYYDINCLDGLDFGRINAIESEQDTMLYDYAYSIKNSAWARERLEEFSAKELAKIDDDAFFDGPDQSTQIYPIIMSIGMMDASGLNNKRIDKLCKKIRKRNGKSTKKENKKKVDWI